MRVISVKKAREFIEEHADAAPSLMNWYRITRKAEWTNFSELRKDFASADIVGRRTVFNIKGNDYRLIARINYVSLRVFVLFIMTHAEYDKGDWK